MVGMENLALTAQPVASCSTEGAITAISSSLIATINYLLNNRISFWERVEFEFRGT
jgi:hypothetical protein